MNRHGREVDDAVRRSVGRARSVETPDHLPDAARDAYLLAKEYEILRQENQNLRRFKMTVQKTVRTWCP